MDAKTQGVDGRFPKVAPVADAPDCVGLADVAGSALDRMGSAIDQAFGARDAMIRELYAYVGILVRRCNDAERDILRLRLDLKKRTRKHPAKKKRTQQESKR